MLITKGMDLGAGFLSGLRRSAKVEKYSDLDSRDNSLLSKSRMELVLKHSDVLYIESIGRGIHRPYKVRLKNAEREGCIDCSEVVFKTVHCQYETKKYCQ